MPLWITYIGVRKTKELLITQRLIDGNEAERIGLAYRSVPADKLEAEVWQMVKLLTDVNPDKIAIQKEAFNTHQDITGRSAVFRYHSQLNARHRVGIAAEYLDFNALRKEMGAKDEPAG